MKNLFLCGLRRGSMAARFAVIIGLPAFMVVLTTLSAAPVFAQGGIPVDLFELDGNTLNDSSVSGYDWNSVGPADPSVNALDGPGGLIFTKGSKDTRDVSRWVAVDRTNVTPKDDIESVYGAAYVSTFGATNGDTILYFGLQRYDKPQGTDASGFWLLQGDVEYDPATGEFIGEHKEGDTLLVVNTQGQSIVGIVIYQWQGGDGDAGSLVEVTNGGIVPDCSNASISGDHYQTPICGRNSEDELFLEIGVNLLDLFDKVPCINNTVWTTRASNSETASTKNLHLEDFQLCKVSVSKVCDVVEINNPLVPDYRVEYTATVTNDGPGAFSATDQIVVTDDAGDGFGNGNDIVTTRTIGELTAPGDGSDGFQAHESLTVVLAGESFTGSYISTNNPPSNQVKAEIRDSADNFIVEADKFAIDCTDLDLTKNLFIEKACSNVVLTTLDVTGTPLNHVGIHVEYDMRTCNTSSFPLFEVEIKDPTAGVDETVDLGPGVLCYVDPSTGDSCPAGSSCVGWDSGTVSTDPSDDTFGVCVYDDSETLGPDGEGGDATVCARYVGRYLLKALPGDAVCSPADETSLSNTAQATAYADDNPLLDTDIIDSATDNCNVCDPAHECP